MTKERFLKTNIRPLEWTDDAPDASGNIRRSHAKTDTWTAKRFEDIEDGDATEYPRILNTFVVFMDDEDNLFAASIQLNKPATPVESLEEGKALCERWHQEYWHMFLEKIADAVISFD